MIYEYLVYQRFLRSFLILLTKKKKRTDIIRSDTIFDNIV